MMNSESAKSYSPCYWLLETAMDLFNAIPKKVTYRHKFKHNYVDHLQKQYFLQKKIDGLVSGK